MQTLLTEMQTITNFESGDAAHDTKQLEQLQVLQKQARGAVKDASPADQLAFLEGYFALNERIGHRDSFGVMKHFGHTADIAWLALKKTHAAEIQALVEQSVRRRLNTGTLDALKKYGTLARAIEVLTELRGQGATFVGHGGQPSDGDYEYHLKTMAEDLEDGADEDDEDDVD